MPDEAAFGVVAVEIAVSDFFAAEVPVAGAGFLAAAALSVCGVALCCWCCFADDAASPELAGVIFFDDISSTFNSVVDFLLVAEVAEDVERACCFFTATDGFAAAMLPVVGKVLLLGLS